MRNLKNIFIGLSFLFVATINIGNLLAKDNFAQTNNANIEILFNDTFIESDQEFIAAIKFTLTPGWHIYWKNPGDSGLPPEINWKLPKGLEVKEILWPVPELASLDPLTSYGYYDELVLPIRFIAGEGFSFDQNFSASISFLICDDICIPEDTNINVNFSKSNQINSKEIINRWIKRLPEQASFKVNAFLTDETFKISWDDPRILQSAFFYPEQSGLINYSSEQIFVTQNGESSLLIDRPENFREENNIVSGILELSTQNKKNYYEVSSNIERVSFIEVNKDKGLNFFIAIFLAFIGGIILNAMPCVFPVIALKVMSLVNESGKSNSWKHGLVFTLGIEVSMLILLSATLLVKNLGQFVGWGWQLQSSLMSSLLALLFFVLGIIFISRIEFGNFMTRLGNINVNKSGYSNSFLLGFLTVIVATPCTGPYMGAAIGWGISQPITISALIFLSLGFGIAFPTFLLSILPKGINFLPKPGPWMENVARFMGVPMFLTSLWLSWVVYRQTGLEGIIVLSFAALAILIAFIMLKASSSKTSRIGLPLIALSFLITIIFVPSQTTNNNQDINFGKRWSAEKVKQLREEEKRILLNFTADWCLTCKVNERLVFNSEDFVKLVETGEIEYLIADWTKYDPNITAELEKYKRAGVPLYLYWGEGSDEVKILPSVLTKSILYDHLKL